MRRHVRIFVPGAALACAQTLFYFSFRSSQNHRRARDNVITRAPIQDGVFDEIDDFKFRDFTSNRQGYNFRITRFNLLSSR